VDVVREGVSANRTIQRQPDLDPLDSTVERTAVAEMLANDTDKPLYGIPFAVKDNIDVAGIPTTAGCPAFSYVPKVTATVVERLLDAGEFSSGKRILISLPPDWSASARPTALATRFSIPTIFRRIKFGFGGRGCGRIGVVCTGELIRLVLVAYRRHSITLSGSNRRVVSLVLSVLYRLALAGLRELTHLGLPAMPRLSFLWLAAYDPRDPYSRRLEPWTLFPGKVRIGVLSSLDLIDEPFRLLYRQTVERMEKLGHST